MSRAHAAELEKYFKAPKWGTESKSVQHGLCMHINDNQCSNAHSPVQSSSLTGWTASKQDTSASLKCFQGSHCNLEMSPRTRRTSPISLSLWFYLIAVPYLKKQEWNTNLILSYLIYTGYRMLKGYNLTFFMMMHGRDCHNVTIRSWLVR